MIGSRGWLCVVLLATLATAGASGASGATVTPAGERGAFGADDIVITVTLQENGTAVWKIAYHYRLTSPNRTAGFQRLRERIDAEQASYAEEVRTDVKSTVSAAQRRTGRSMSVSGVEVRTRRQSLPRETGIVVLRFVWDGFGVANGTHIRAGDAIRGFYLGSRSELRVQWPEGYTAATVDPPADAVEGREVVWRGGGLGTDEPRLVFERSRAAPLWTLAGAAGVVLAVLGAGGTAVYVRRRGESTGDRDCDGEQSVDPPDGRASDAGTDGPPGPLSNEERVKWVLEARGGRVKQQTLAEECGWGDSKTSRVVRDLEEAGEIERFRLGRENVVSLPEVDVDET